MRAIFVMPFNHGWVPVNDRNGGDGATMRSRIGHIPRAGTDEEVIDAPEDVIAEMKLHSDYVWLEDVPDGDI